MSEAPYIVLESVEVTYQRAILGVQNISLSIARNSATAILGANGAGKTTTLRAMSGFIALDQARVTKGSISFDGERIERALPHEIARRGIVLVPERDKIFPNLTIAENLVVSRGHAATLTERRQREALVYDMFPRIAQLRSREAGLLSGGERQMLAIGSALVCMPKVLLIDELSLGLAPVIVGDLCRRIADIRRELAITIVIVEQSARIALDMADYGYVLENGVVALEGPAEELKSNRRIQDLYLGSRDGARRSYRDIVDQDVELHS
jgi:branched-chain amino acid transport system ATP-binding protein